MNILRITTVVLCGMISAVCFAGEATLKEETVDGKIAYRMENYRVSLLIAPGRGGGVVSYRDKLGGDVELIPPSPMNGLCLDHFQVQPWPGELLGAVYEGHVVKQDADECVVETAYTVKGKWGISEYPKLDGLRLEKTYTLKADSPALSCRIKITNPKKEARLVDYWMQNVFFAGGTFDLDTDKSFRPSVRGVRVHSAQKSGHAGKEDFLADFSDGWMALLDTKAKSGLIILTNYNDLRCEYVCAGSRTLELMFDVAYLPSGTSREYWTDIVPVAGLDNVVTATRDYVAGYKMQSDGKGGGTVELAMVRSTRTVKQISLQLRTLNVQNRAQTASAGCVTFDTLTDAPQVKRSSFTGAGADPLALQVEVKAESARGAAPAQYQFEEYYNGAYQWGENIKTDMRSPIYVGIRPSQQVLINKPNPVKLKRLWGRKAWYVEGLLDDCYGVTSSIRMTHRYDGTAENESAARVFVSGGGSLVAIFRLFPTTTTSFLVITTWC